MTSEDHREVAIQRARESHDRIRGTMKAARTDPERQAVVRYTQGTADGVRDAFAEVLCEIHGIALAQADAIRQLQERITTLEATSAAVEASTEQPAGTRLALVAGAAP